MTDPNISFLHEVHDFSDFYSEVFNNSDFKNMSDFIVDITTMTCEPIPIAVAVNIVVCAFYGVVFLLAIPGNLIVGLVLGFNRQLLSPSDVYLFHLVVADTLLALILPFWATAVVWGWVFGDAMCKLVSLVKEVNFYTSILFLVCISVDRYMVIVRATKARNSQRRQCSWAVCAAVWALGAALSLPALYNKSFQLPDGGQAVCSEHYDPESAEEWRLATRVLCHLLGFLLPLDIMLACYGVTVARLLRTRGFKRQRAMRVIVAVVVAFLLCWTPYHIAMMADTLLRTKLVQHDCDTRNAVDVVMFATQNLGLLHCCINPVLYAFMGEKFRRNFLQLLYRWGVLKRGSVTRASRSTSQTTDPTSTLL